MILFLIFSQRHHPGSKVLEISDEPDLDLGRIKAMIFVFKF